MADRFNLGSFVEAVAYAGLDEIFATFRSDDGFAKPHRYEVFFFPPVSSSRTNIFAQIMGQSVADQTARKTALRCQSFSFPGRNLDSSPDTNIYGPEREIVQGYSYGDVTGVFQCSSDMKEKRFFETWQRLAYNPQTWAMQYYNDYVGSIKLFQLDETDRQRYESCFHQGNDKKTKKRTNRSDTKTRRSGRLGVSNSSTDKHRGPTVSGRR